MAPLDNPKEMMRDPKRLLTGKNAALAAGAMAIAYYVVGSRHETDSSKSASGKVHGDQGGKPSLTAKHSPSSSQNQQSSQQSR